ncbi:CAP domain-containing protein [Nannocystaceae bacterium ST9]
MRAAARASMVLVLTIGCYGGVEDDMADELGGTGTDTEVGDGDGDASSDSTSSSADDATNTSTSTSEADTSTSEADTSTSEADTTTGDPPAGCTADAIELIGLVNDYRAENGLPAIPASNSLCTVATTHVHDLNDNSPHTQPGGCNLHSWSDQGPWSPCCYTPDHAQAQCMWDKPSELTVYPGYGYENAVSGIGTPAQALDAWKSSPGHNEVILNQGIWVDHPWQALGADVYQGFSVLWFGEQPDPG